MNTKKPIYKQLSKLEKGQSLVETSLGMVIILTMLMGLFDFGRIYHLYLALEDSAGEAALYLSINPNCSSEASGTECANPNNATFRARNAAGGQLNWENVDIEVETPSPLGVGETVTVTMRYTYEFVTPVIPQTTQLTLTSSASQIVITEPSS